MSEADITGGGGGEASTPLTASFKFNAPGLDDTTSSLKELRAQITGLKSDFMGLANNQGQLTQAANTIFSSITRGAQNATNALNTSGSGSMMSGGGASMYGTALGGGSGGSNNYFGGALGGAMNAMSGMAGNGNLIESIAKILTAPVKYSYDRIEENRGVTQGMAQMLGPSSTLSGNSIESIIHGLGNKIPVRGGIQDILSAISTGSATGYADLTGAGGKTTAARTGAYYTGLREMQAFTPSVGAGQLAQQFSAQLGNTSSQQRSMILTGGAMGNFGAGGVPKTLSEWAEGLIKFFQNLRPGAKRGVPFTKEEISTQMFPGSNIDAWFSTNQVPDYMREYFWQYAIGKSQATGGTGGTATIEQITGKRGDDLAYEQLRTASASSRRDFILAGRPGYGGASSFYKNYAIRERSDRAMLDAMRGVDAGMAGGLSEIGQLLAYLPTPIASALAGIATETMPSMAGSIGNAIFMGGFGDPEVGDIGDYGPYGGTGTAGMDPSLARKVSAMQRANPNVKIVSGFRDGALQGRLHSKGVGRTAPAGKSSHGRGWAADLGPRSQYGWIQKNASKFGLAGAGHVGEPWHVGLPGTVNSRIGDVGIGDFPGWDDWQNAFSLGSAVATDSASKAPLPIIGSSVNDIKGVVGGAGDFLSFMSDMIGGLKDLVSGDFSSLFGKGGFMDFSSIGQSLLSGLFGLTGIPDAMNFFSGGKSSAKSAIGGVASFLGNGGILSPLLTSSTDWSAGAGASMTSNTRPGGSFFGNAAGAFGGSANVQSILQKYNKGQATNAGSIKGHESGVLDALRAAQAAGFSGDELIAIASIAGRESTWNPAAHRSSLPLSQMSGDRGEWQINYIHDPALAKAGIISSNTIQGKKELFDIGVNARAAKLVGGNGLSAWNMGPGGPGTGPPLYKAAQYVEPVYNLAKQYGMVGDPEYYAPPTAMRESSSGSSMTPMIFQNNFTIQSNGGDADARRLAAVVADQLESQMHDRATRSN